jgi:thiosulfate/3-mercaptopyruvate sulfurtransferase
MSKLGIGDNTYVLAYDDTGGMTAARLVVMLRMIGRSASLINGGLQAWVASSDDPLESGEPGVPTPGHFTTTSWPDSRLINFEELRALVTESRTDSNSVLLDARAANRFEGRAPEAVPQLDPRPGHIPGAINAPWAAVLDPKTSHFRSTTEITEHFAQLGVSPSANVIAYCGSGVSACLNIIALEYAGLPPARLFIPSWSGWASDVDNPSETGPAMKKGNRD